MMRFICYHKWLFVRRKDIAILKNDEICRYGYSRDVTAAHDSLPE